MHARTTLALGVALAACARSATHPASPPCRASGGGQRRPPAEPMAQLRPRSRRDALLAARADRPRQRGAARARVDVSHRRARDAQRQRERARRAPSAGVRDDAARWSTACSISPPPTSASSRSTPRRGASAGRTIRTRAASGCAPARRTAASRTGRDAGPTARRDARIVYGTIDGRLIALDARTGRPVPSFGEGGAVNLRAGMTDVPGAYGDDVAAGDLPRPRHHRRARARGRGARAERRHPRVRRAHGEARVALPHACRARASQATRRGSRARGATAPAPTSGRS